MAGILDRAIEQDMKESYLDYAMSVIVGRALPDVRDGLKPVHRRILYAMSELGNTHDKPYKKSARVVGECFVKGTLVLTGRGLVPIKEVEKGELVFTRSGKKQVAELYEMPEKELLKVTLENGISATVTKSQKFRVINERLEYEWKEADGLSENDYLVIRADYPEIEECAYLGEFNGKKIYLNEGIGYLIGQLLSDGWVEKGCRRGYPFRCGFCSASRAVMGRIAGIIRREFGCEAAIEERDYEYETSGGMVMLKKLYSVRINSSAINEFLVTCFGLQNAYAATKEIPPQITVSPKSVIYSFISGLIDGDGSIHAGRNVIHYGSVSPRLMETLQILLQHLGILSKRYVTAKSGEREVCGRTVKANYPFHSLEVRGRFAALLGSRLDLTDGQKAERLRNKKSELKICSLDGIPHAGKMIFGELGAKHIGSGWYADKDGKKFRAGIKYRTGTKIRYSKDLREKMLARTQIVDWGIAEKLNKIDSRLSKFVNEVLNNNIYFLKVEKIENAVPEKTYDIEVEDDHEFIANGIVSHNCLGKYHPHGDVAIYDSLVRMAQDFSMRYTLVDGQGNFGSIDGDNAAAMRYSEVRMKKLAEEMLADIEKETVDFTPNFDGTLKEPTVLPSRVPTLLVNGSSGIAVGMATNIPPHNLGEIIDALIAVIEGADELKILQIVPGPDFPTGGTIVGRSGIYEAYKTGRGIIRLRSKIEINEKDRMLVVREIPYQITKVAIIDAIADAVKEKRLEGISGIHDRSDKEGMEVVIELKKDAAPEVVLNQLYAHTPLESTFGINNLALVNNSPKTLPLYEMLRLFVEFRQEIVRKRCAFEKKQAEARAHILEGLMVALRNIDRIIQFLKASRDVKAAKAGLIQDYSLSEKQAEAIVEMKLRALTGLEREKIESELAELEKLIAWLAEVLADEKRILAIIREELLEIRKKYADARKTGIIEAADERTVEDLIPNEDVVVTISHRGYVKRVPLQEYRTQRRGGKGVVGSETKEEDFVEDVIVTKTHNYMLFFTDKGRVHWLKAYNIPEAGRYASGKPIVNMLELREERVTAWIEMRSFSDKEFLVMITRNGIVKRIGADAFANPRKGGVIALTLKEGDSLIDVKKTGGNGDVFIATKEGYAIRFNENDARELGRTGQGVIGIRLREKDEVIGATTCEKPTVLTITENGYGKRTEFSEYRVQARGGLGVTNMNCTGKTGKVVAVKAVDDSGEVIVVSSKGQTIRSPVKGIRVIGRNTQGVRILRLGEGEKVASFAAVQGENGTS